MDRLYITRDYKKLLALPYIHREKYGRHYEECYEELRLELQTLLVHDIDEICRFHKWNGELICEKLNLDAQVDALLRKKNFSGDWYYRTMEHVIAWGQQNYCSVGDEVIPRKDYLKIQYMYTAFSENGMSEGDISDKICKQTGYSRKTVVVVCNRQKELSHLDISDERLKKITVSLGGFDKEEIYRRLLKLNKRERMIAVFKCGLLDGRDKTNREVCELFQIDIKRIWRIDRILFEIGDGKCGALNKGVTS